MRGLNLTGSLLITLLASGLNAQVIDLDLETAVTLALENNVQMKNALEEREKAHLQRKEALATAMPVVSGFMQGSRNLSIAGQPVEFPIPYGVLDAAGNPVNLLDDSGNPVPFITPDGTVVPGLFLQQTGIQLVPFEFAFGNDNMAVYGLSLTQPIFEGRVIAGIRGANVYDDLAEASLEVTRLTVIEQTEIAFYQALMAQKLLQVMTNSLEVARNNLRDARALYQQGRAAEFDVIRAEVAVANGETGLSNGRKMERIAKAGLKRACGMTLDRQINLAGDLVSLMPDHPSLEELEQKLLAHQPLLHQLDASKRLMKENILMARAELMPQIALTGSYSQQKPFNDSEWDDRDFNESSSISLGINVPIFKGGGAMARVKKAKADHRKAQYQEMDLRENLLLELSNLYLSLNEAASRIEAGLKGVELARKGVEMAEKLYTEGMSTQVQVLDAQNARDQAELGLYQAYFEYYAARASLTRAVGGSL